MSSHSKSMWRHLAGTKDKEGHGSWSGTVLALKAAENLKDQGFSGYEPPTKLVKVKERLSNAEYLAFLPDDGIVVSDVSSNCIRIFNVDGSYRKCLVNGLRCLGVTTNRSGMVAFVENRRGSDKFIRVVSSDDGCEFAKWGEDMIWKPRGIAMNNKGQLVITDTYKQRHQVGLYTLDGRNIVKFGTQGAGDWDLHNPWYVTVDPFDRILVSDHSNHCVKVFDDHGTFLMKIGQRGSGDGDLVGPRGVCADSKGNLLVADSGNKRISLFSSDGKFCQHLLEKSDGLAFPRDLALDRATGVLAVSQHDSVNSDTSFRKLRLYQLETL